MNKILSLGDCNTLGIESCKGNAYPERFARRLGCDVCNCGFTMATLREAEYFFRDFYDRATNILTLQYGLVDSWETFVYSPYVLYYPDNPLRKILRKAVKRYKKTCRRLGLNAWLGTAPVVSPEMFSRGVHAIIAACRPDTRILLVETVPNLDASRNSAIQRYNRLLRAAAHSDPRCDLVETFDYFWEYKEGLYADDTHINGEGHEWIARGLYQLVNQETVRK